MKIAFFADSLPPSTDGVSRTLERLVNTLQQEKLDFYFFSPFRPDANYFWTEKVNQVSSIPLILYSDYRISLPAQRKIYERMDEFKPDIVHSTSPTFLGQVGLNYARKKGIPAVSSYHTHFVSYFKYYGFALFENLGWNFLKWFYNQFDRIYAPSQSTIRELAMKGFEKIELWQRGIDLNVFNPQKRDDALRNRINPEDSPILLFVGRLVKEKDLEDLVAVDRILKAKQRHFKIVIVGNGPMLPKLKAELPDACFPGYLYGNELAKMYASSDVFVFPSTTETFGNVILEAYASGLPVVGVNEGGVIDLIMDGHTGFISLAKDTADIASKVDIFLCNPSLRQRYADNALKFAKQFSWDKINKGLISSYQKLIQQSPSIHQN